MSVAKRPLLTFEAITAVAASLRSGVARPRALKQHGLTPAKMREITALAMQGVEPYAQFMAGLDEAEAAAESAFVATIAESKDWRAAAFLLERRFPEEWGQKIQIEVEEQLKEIFRLAEATLPETHYVKLLEAVARARGSDPVGASAPAGETQQVH